MARPQLLRVATRLFAKDVEEIKRRAEEESIPWQTYLRTFVTKALKRKQEIR
jgi:predicted DNA binding CopG/RHH family protein